MWLTEFLKYQAIEKYFVVLKQLVMTRVLNIHLGNMSTLGDSDQQCASVASYNAEWLLSALLFVSTVCFYLFSGEVSGVSGRLKAVRDAFSLRHNC